MYLNKMQAETVFELGRKPIREVISWGIPPKLSRKP
jgi:hypothetical protein